MNKTIRNLSLITGTTAMWMASTLAEDAPKQDTAPPQSTQVQSEYEQQVQKIRADTNTARQKIAETLNQMLEARLAQLQEQGKNDSREYDAKLAVITDEQNRHNENIEANQKIIEQLKTQLQQHRNAYARAQREQADVAARYTEQTKEQKRAAELGAKTLEGAYGQRKLLEGEIETTADGLEAKVKAPATNTDASVPEPTVNAEAQPIPSIRQYVREALKGYGRNPNAKQILTVILDVESKARQCAGDSEYKAHLDQLGERLTKTSVKEVYALHNAGSDEEARTLYGNVSDRLRWSSLYTFNAKSRGEQARQQLENAIGITSAE